MASSLNIEGPCSLLIRAASSETPWSLSTHTLGNTDNDDLIEISFEDHIHEVKSVDQGDEIAEAVFLGRIGTLTCTLVKWDVGNELFLTAPGGSADGDAGVIGTEMSQTTAFAYHLRIARSITPVTAVPDYIFHLAYINTWRYLDFGNKEKRLALEFTLVTNGSVLYEEATSLVT